MGPEEHQPSVSQKDARGRRPKSSIRSKNRFREVTKIVTREGEPPILFNWEFSSVYRPANRVEGCRCYSLGFMDRERTKNFRQTKKRDQESCPMIADQFGRIVDGWHRSDAGWTRREIIPVKDDLDFWVKRLHFNQGSLTSCEPCLAALFWIIGRELMKKGAARVAVCQEIASSISPYPAEYTESLVADVFKPDKFDPGSASSEPHEIPSLPSIFRTYYEHGMCLHDTSRLFKPLSDRQWRALAPLMPPKAKTGRPRSDDRATLEAILYHIETGGTWDRLPRTLVPKSTANDRLVEWKENGLWERIIGCLKSNGYRFSDNT